VQEEERIDAPKGTFRGRKRPHRFGGYVALMSSISDAKPYSFEEVDKLQVWKVSMLEEYRSIIKNNVWDIVSRPKDKSMVSSKWIYKIKHVVDGSVEKFKARFVSRGFTQKEGINYEETFFSYSQVYLHSNYYFFSFHSWLEDTSDGFKNNILEWKY
jgi:hypothetical protein